MMVIVVISLLALTFVGIWKRRPLAFVVVVLSMGYLAIADGGNFPSAEPERYLPTEWGLERCCIGHTAMNSGRRRSNSLTEWALAVNPNHKDWHYATQSKSKADANTRRSWTITTEEVTDETLDELLEMVDSGPALPNPMLGVTIKLPKITPVTIVTISRNRDSPQNRSFFIVGHCLFVILISALTFSYIFAVPLSRSRIRQNSGSETS